MLGICGGLELYLALNLHRTRITVLAIKPEELTLLSPNGYLVYSSLTRSPSQSPQ